MSVARDGRTVVGVPRALFAGAWSAGEERSSRSPCTRHARVRARAGDLRASSSASTSARRRERGVALVLAFASAPTAPIFLGPLGWTELPSVRVWARPLRARRTGEGSRAAQRSDSTLRDAQATQCRGLAEPRRPGRRLPQLALRSTRRGATACVEGEPGYAVVGRTRYRGVTTARRDLVGPARKLLRRASRASTRRDIALVVRRPGSAGAFSRSASCPRRTRFTVHGQAARSQAGVTSPRRGGSRSATRTSSERKARLHHAAGRPRPSGARGDGAEDPRARGAGGRGRRARRPHRRRGAAGQLPLAVVRRRTQGGPRRALRAALARELSPQPRRRRRAHVPDLRRARRAARPAAPRPARCSGTRTGRGRDAGGRRARWRRAIVTVDPRSFPIDSQKVVPIGHGIDLDEFPCVDRRTGRATSCSSRSAATRGRRGSRRSCAVAQRRAACAARGATARR